MPTIRISDESMRRLKAWAEPLEDTANSALEKALDAAERYVAQGGPRGLDPVRRSRPAANRLLKLPEEEFFVPLLETIHEMDGAAHVRDIRPAMKERLRARMLPHDFERVPSGEERWWNTVHTARFRLVRDGLLRKDSRRGVWALSEKGSGFVEARLGKSGSGEGNAPDG